MIKSVKLSEVYDINLFNNRIEFIKKGFYDELHLLISKIINEKRKNSFNTRRRITKNYR